MKKKIFILALSSLFVASLTAGCGNSKEISKSETTSSVISESATLSTSSSTNTLSDSKSDNFENSSSSDAEISLKQAADSQNKSDKAVSEAATTETETEDKQVKAAWKLYEATYFDESIYGFEDDKIIDGVYQLDDYYEVDISNVTDTSFNFAIYEVDGETDNRSLIFKNHTAVFTGDGTTAAYNGEKYTLNFTFPDMHGAHPDIADMQISGFPPLEGVTLVYNDIPGHEFG